MSSFTSFGSSIPVTGPNIGFPGTISRFGERVIAARPFSPANTALNLNFGDPAVLVPNSTANLEDSYTSVKDFIAAAIANTALLYAYFAGMAVREVKTQLGYPQTPGVLATGYYASGQMAEVLERGSATIYLSVGAPDSQAQLYTRLVLNGVVTAGLVGDWETNPAATDLFALAASGTAAAGQKVIPVASTTNVQVGQLVTGPGGSAGQGGEQTGIPKGAYVASFIANTSITLNVNLTSALASGQVMSISNLLSIPGCVARTGYLDANNALEITFKNRLAA